MIDSIVVLRWSWSWFWWFWLSGFWFDLFLHQLMIWLGAAERFSDDHDHDFDYDDQDFDLILIIDDMIDSCSVVLRWWASWTGGRTVVGQMEIDQLQTTSILQTFYYISLWTAFHYICLHFTTSWISTALFHSSTALHGSNSTSLSILLHCTKHCLQCYGMQSAWCQKRRV